MNRKGRIKILLYKLNKVYSSDKWHVADNGKEHFYLYCGDMKIVHFRKTISDVEVVIKFVKLMIIDSPESFGIKKIICKIKPK